MTLIIENVGNELLPALKSVAKLGNCNIKVKKEKQHRLKPEVEKAILQDLAEIEEERKNGTLKTFKTAREMHEDIFKNG
ncbi:hypothetical protein [Helicobacter sp. 11S02596-1]|uniref:hypothetical protein n=1 Tax=Helicobacter sp. 11S02596-1 TaxID=1476194 RepID=UPI000BA743B8|nr:hypothetical protein [Helicobacter sp. 11S02596-1]PAF41201.1 hypothetical protein BJI48_08960 [Helicobacter sp. 11S02596-1]